MKFTILAVSRVYCVLSRVCTVYCRVCELSRKCTVYCRVCVLCTVACVYCTRLALRVCQFILYCTMSMYYTIYYTVLSRVCQLGLEESSDEEIKRETLFHIKDEKCSALPKNDGKTFTRVLIFKFAINRVQVKALLVPGQPLKPLVKATISWFL